MGASSGFHRIVNITGPGLLLQESMYGFIMALIFITAAKMGFLVFDSTSSLILTIIGMNFTWGVIDMVIFFLVDRYDQDRHVKIIKTKDHCKRSKDIIHDNLSGTIVDNLTEEDESKIIDLIIDGSLESEGELKHERKMMAVSAFMCFLITSLTAIPVIIPIIFISNLSSALFWSSGVAATCMFFIGYGVATHTGVNKWVMGFGIALLAWGISILATFTGG